MADWIDDLLEASRRRGGSARRRGRERREGRSFLESVFNGSPNEGRSERQDREDFFTQFLDRYKPGKNVTYVPRDAGIEPFEAGPPPDFLSQFAINLPGPVLTPLPDRNAYIAPYDRAQWVAQDTYNQAGPVINNIYDTLGEALRAREAEAATKSGELRAASGAEQAAVQQQAQALTAPTGLANALGGTPEANAQAEADRAFLATQAGNVSQLQRGMEQARVSDQQARTSDAEALRSNSLSNAQTNLDSILNQIGLGRAKAEQQFTTDTANVTAQNQEAQNQYSLLRQQMQADQLRSAQEAEQLWAEQNERRAQSAVTSGRSTWEGLLERRLTANPNASAAMLDIIDAAGSGPTAKATALQMLDATAEDMKNRRYETASGQRLNTRLNPEIVRSWILEYYDEAEQVDPRRFAELGGDPTYLPVRGMYAS